MVVLNGVLSILGAILEGLRALASVFTRLPFLIKFVAIWLGAVLYLLYNASALYQEKASYYTVLLLVYTAALGFAFANTSRPNPFLSISLGEFVFIFAIYASLGYAAFKLLAPLDATRIVLNTQNVAVAFTHIFVIAMGEELLFRVVFPNLLSPPLHPMAAQILSGLAFGGFHMAAYAGSPVALVFASIMGIIFGAIVYKNPRYGIVITSALHAAWNLSRLGYG